MSAYHSVVVEADGGSRGNPGQAAYGALLKDAVTGGIIAEIGERIGIATNNVAEYRGLIAGLELYRRHADGAALEVRMDSKLVVEQMSGRWKIKHPDMRPLALEASRLAPPGTTYTWIPRERNRHADRLVNEALDARVAEPPAEPAIRGAAPVEQPSERGPSGAPATSTAAFTPPWEQGTPTTLILVRHGETSLTRDRRFSGRGGSDPALTEDGRTQVRDTAEWLAPLGKQVEVMLSSPLRRTRETAEILAERLDLTFDVEDGLVESAFGTWDGLTYAEVIEREPEVFRTWLESVDRPAGGHGDSLSGMAEKMTQALERVLGKYAGQTILAVSHVTPIKLLLAHALQMPLTSTYRVEVAPASVTVIAWYPDGHPVVRLLNGRPAELAFGR